MMKISKRSILTGKLNSMELDITLKQIADWQSGTLIQNAMPNLTPTEREFFITGMSPEEQNQMYGEEE